MAASNTDLAHRFLITSAPTPLALVHRQATAPSSKTFNYPECRDDPNGPCALEDKSSSTCQKQFPSSVYHKQHCMCTNGYYERSSECWTDCYHKTSIDPTQASRESRLQVVKCESVSLAMESDDAFWSSVSAKSRSQSDSDRISTTANGSAARTGGGAGRNATQGATGDVPPLETLGFTERPAPTGQARQGGQASMTRGTRWNAGVSVVVLLVIASVFHG
ncbi:hypothetical protein PRK78_004109 [Emydomyces testavorans]|uniref:Uncharacterized protein n=1 Tax=Emydomyces testavorans TaxID=2070801 RepID=A0AAF0DJK0_9EURO|nr:hypothetical protein PRK78_004109 [Emydomyces testavorans]